MLSDTQQRLTEWARWVQTSDSGLRMGYNRVSLVPAGSVAMPVCSDEQALMVDRAIARLRQRDQNMAEVLVMAYSCGFSLTRIAREAGIVAGLPAVSHVFEALGDEVVVDTRVSDGDAVEPDEVLVR
ncbi:MAG: antiterminator Q family protein, partial [Pseudomonadota bacterium]|nr:antiterminator Q family protein [Pseudomonadota bacterium]